MKDSHAADHDSQAAYLRDLRQTVETAERCNVMYRPPDFTMFPTYADLQRRRKTVTAFGLGLGVGTMLGVIAAVLLLP